MKETVTSLDLMFLVPELRQMLVGGKVRGIKQAGKEFSLEIYKENKFFLNVIPGRAIYVTTAGQKAPQKPPDFCMLLRKHMLNKTISDISQHEFDRIVEIDVDGCRLVIELFSTGNVILTEKGMIIGLLERRAWKDRTLKPKEFYRYPPGNLNPLKYSFFGFRSILAQTGKDVVRSLATDFGFGGTYAEEACKVLVIDKDKPTTHLSQQEVDRLFRFVEQLKWSKPKPAIFFDDKTEVDVVPIGMETYKDYGRKEFNSFNKAVEAYFEALKKLEKKKKVAKVSKTERERIKKIQKSQEAQLEDLRKREERCRRIANLLYREYAMFVKVLAQLSQWKDEGKAWKEIKKLARAQGMVKDLKPRQALIIFTVEGTDVELDFRKSVKESANYFFEESKKAKRKAEGLVEAMEKFKVRPLFEEKPEAEKPEAAWYEKYRWFVSSDGILVIAGKNAEQNEDMIRKHARPYDVVVHADIHGSPFAVIRNDKKSKVQDRTIEEAAQFVAAYSRAWDLKLVATDVYYIAPDQVVKEPGLPLGSFMIRGERRWLRKVKTELAVGIKQEVMGARLISGSPAMVREQTGYAVVVVPGERSADRLAKQIKIKLLRKVPVEIKNAVKAIDLEKIKRIIPHGRGELG